MGPIERALFTPENGGQGVTVSCSFGVSTRAAIPSPTHGSVYAVNNTGLDYCFLAFGNSTITATAASMAFPPGLSYIGIPNANGGSAPTHVAGTCGPTSILVQISLGTLTVL